MSEIGREEIVENRRTRQDEDKEEPMTMQGFDDDFTDIVDYILKITHRIWEEKGIGRIYDYYTHNAVVHTNGGDIVGNEELVQGTLQTLAAFPDRHLYDEEVIWAEEHAGGYYTSHRILHTGRNTGPTAYAPATGRAVSYRAIADCRARDNRIYEEWLVRDNLVLLAQLGIDARALAQALAEKQAAAGRHPAVVGEVERLQGQAPPPQTLPLPDAASDLEQWLRQGLHDVWNRRLLNRVPDLVSPTFTGYSASGRYFRGPAGYQAYILSLLSPFPDLALSIDHFCANPDRQRGARAAVRWTMQGTHTGPGNYGEPTGNRIRIMGMSHFLIRDGALHREWSVFDEFALLQQVYAP